MHHAIDGHIDLLHHLRFKHPASPFSAVQEGHLSADKFRQGGVRVFLSAYFLPDASLGPGVQISLDDAVSYVDRYAPEIETIQNPAMLREAFESSEGPPKAIRLLENSDQLLEYDLDAFASQGFKVAGLTHFGENRLAGGDRADSSLGLTPAGRDMLGRLARRGVILDTAHLNEASFFQALDAYPGPVLCSHTGFRAFHDTPRNLGKDQLAALVDRGAVVGVAAAPEILQPGACAGLYDVVRAIDWAVERHGPSSIAMGSDFGGFDATCRGLEHVGLFPAVAEALSGLGYSEPDVAGIMGGNWLRFFEQNW